MDFRAESLSQLPSQMDCLIVGIFEQNQLSLLAQELDQKSQGTISAFLKHGDFSGKANETAWLYAPAGIAVDRLLLVGCGNKNTLSDQDFYKLMRTISGQLKSIKAKQAVYALPSLPVKQDAAWLAKQAIFTLYDELYTFTQLKSKTDNNACTITQLDFYTPDSDLKAINQALNCGLTLAKNVKLTRDLANLPPNICTPAYLAEQAQKAAKEVSSLKIEVLDEAQMRELKMGTLLAVAQGSQHSPKLVVIHYNGAVDKNAKPFIFVGKGITFDTGGINLKPSTGIVGMKYDMCGAASVLGTLKTVAELKLPINVIGIMVCVENMVGSRAYRPDDVITSMSGQTIEINNTDAEGRLILCDALTYCARFQPQVVVDIATLTGAIIIALGKHASGLFSNNQTLADDLLKAGQESGDRVWQLPLWDDYQPQLDSVVADMVNSATSGGNSITAACFLSRFTKDYTWAHLDIAGTSFQTGSKAFATGRPVPLLVQYLMDKC